MSSDPTIERLRQNLAKEDRAILDAINARLRLVAELKRYKEEAGIPFVDAEQEQRVLDRLAAANRGPLTEEGLRELFRSILALTKHEVANHEQDPRG
jgi:chorismate mutase